MKSIQCKKMSSQTWRR